MWQTQYELDSEKTIQQTKEKIKKFRKEFYGETYEYNPEYKKVLLQLKEKYPEYTIYYFYNTDFNSFISGIS